MKLLMVLLVLSLIFAFSKDTKLQTDVVIENETITVTGQTEEDAEQAKRETKKEKNKTDEKFQRKEKHVEDEKSLLETNSNKLEEIQTPNGPLVS